MIVNDYKISLECIAFTMRRGTHHGKGLPAPCLSYSGNKMSEQYLVAVSEVVQKYKHKILIYMLRRRKMDVTTYHMT